MPETDCKYAGPSTGRVLTVGLTARSVRGRLFGMIVFGVPSDATIRSNRTVYGYRRVSSAIRTVQRRGLSGGYE